MPATTSDVNKHLETLGLGPDDLNEDAIRVAYKKLALKWHPDRHNADPEESKEKFIEVNDAYKALVHECKKRNKHHWLRKEGDGASTLRSFWPSSTPSASSSSSSGSTPSASSSGASCATASTTKQTEIPTAKPTDPTPAKPSCSTKSTDTPPAKRTDVSSSEKKSSSHRAAEPKDARGTRSSSSRRSGDRESSHPSSRTERSHHKASHTSTAAPKSPRPFRTSNLPHDDDSDTSSEADSLHEHKNHYRHNGKGKRHVLEDDYEFIDLGTPLRPLRSPKPLSPTSKDKDWIFPLPLTLEDLYFGAKHRYRVTRTLRTDKSSHSPSSSKTQTVQIDIHVSPGWRDGTRIRVPGVGNQRSDGSFQDIVFVVEEIPHPRFARSGDNIVLAVRVPWTDAHCRRPYPSQDMYEDDDSILGSESSGGGGGRYRFGFGRWRHHDHDHERDEFDDDEVYVMGLDGEEYTLPIPRTLVEAADGTRIFGAGMPIRKNGKVVGKGDLVIRWEFVFPESEKLQRSRWQTLKDAMHLRFQV